MITKAYRSNLKNINTQTFLKSYIINQANISDAYCFFSDKELNVKVSKSEKEIIKNRDDQMKSINEEIINITKTTVAKIADLKISNSDVEQFMKSHKNNLN